MPPREGIGMAMDQFPIGTVAAIDQRHPQRPWLVRQPADFTLAMFNDRQDDHVGAAIGLNQFLLQRAVFEEFADLVPARPAVGPAGRCAAKGRHEGEVIAEGDKPQIGVDVAAHQGCIRLFGSPDEVSDRQSGIGPVYLAARSGARHRHCAKCTGPKDRTS
jgi:hypothetical protein